jgi:hypothetical protein
MSPEENFQEKEVLETEQKVHVLHTVTPLSKYLSMFLFVILPFVGGWIGYKYAPEKVVEVEKVVEIKNITETNSDTVEAEIFDEVIETVSGNDLTVADDLENCFSEIPFGQYSIEHEGNKRLGEGFALWLSDSVVLREPDESNYEQGDYVIQSIDGHKAEVSFVYLGSEVLRSKKMHTPSVVFEPISNAWWFDWSFGEAPSECLPNSTGITKFGDAIYLTQDGDVGAFFKIFTLVSTERLEQPMGSYADAIQVKLSGSVNDPNHQTYEVFESTILEMLYNTKAEVTMG